MGRKERNIAVKGQNFRKGEAAGREKGCDRKTGQGRKELFGERYRKKVHREI